MIARFSSETPYLTAGDRTNDSFAIIPDGDFEANTSSHRTVGSPLQSHNCLKSLMVFGLA